MLSRARIGLTRSAVAVVIEHATAASIAPSLAAERDRVHKQPDVVQFRPRGCSRA
jgi:hypothetical protein